MLTAAAELIAEVGWGRVTTRAVAARAGLPLGAVTYHFRGKQELLTQAALQAVEGVFPMTELAGVGTLPELIRMIRTSVSDRNSGDPVLSGVFMETLREAARSPVLRERMATLLADYRRLLRDLVRTEQQRGAVRAGVDPAAVANLVAAAGDGLLLHALLEPDLEVAACVETLLALLGSAQSTMESGHG